MRKKEYTVKERYCPSKGENIIVKVEASAEHRETCVSCDVNGNCVKCSLGLQRENIVS